MRTADIDFAMDLENHADFLNDRILILEQQLSLLIRERDAMRHKSRTIRDRIMK